MIRLESEFVTIKVIFSGAQTIANSSSSFVLYLSSSLFKSLLAYATAFHM